MTCLSQSSHVSNVNVLSKHTTIVLFPCGTYLRITITTSNKTVITITVFTSIGYDYTLYISDNYDI